MPSIDTAAILSCLDFHFRCPPRVPHHNRSDLTTAISSLYLNDTRDGVSTAAPWIDREGWSRKMEHTRRTPDGERRRDARRRRTGSRRRNDTQKRVQGRNCRFVDTRPVYLPASRVAWWGRLGWPRTRTRTSASAR